MTYVMSDLHGHLAAYIAMMVKIGFAPRDTVYILGDVIDRGKSGIDLLRSMRETPGVIPFIGNHESLALPLLKAMRDGAPLEKIKKSKAYAVWEAIGGGPTAEAFNSHGRRIQSEIIEYVESFTVYDEIEVGGKKFHLSHTLPSYDPGRDVHDVTLHEFIWGEPDYEKRYDPDVTFITGHTPTDLIDPASVGKIWRGNGHIAVDCGASFEGGCLGCLCLDTMEEIYV